MKETQISTCVSSVCLGLDALTCPHVSCKALRCPPPPQAPKVPSGPFSAAALQASLWVRDTSGGGSFCLERPSPRHPQWDNAPLCPSTFVPLLVKWTSLITLFKMSRPTPSTPSSRGYFSPVALPVLMPVAFILHVCLAHPQKQSPQRRAVGSLYS